MRELSVHVAGYENAQLKNFALSLPPVYIKGLLRPKYVLALGTFEVSDRVTKLRVKMKC